MRYRTRRYTPSGFESVIHIRLEYPIRSPRYKGGQELLRAIKEVEGVKNAWYGFEDGQPVLAILKATSMGWWQTLWPIKLLLKDFFASQHDQLKRDYARSFVGVN